MKLPRLNHIDTQTSTVDVFKGYNHNFRIGDGEFYDMKNLTSTYYPVLSPRSKRGTYVENISSQGMIAKDSLCYVDGSKFVINEHPIEMGLNDEPKQLISMGAYVIIMPDKKYINTINHTDKGNIEASFPSVESEIVTATYEMCKLDGTSYTNIIKNSTAPEITDEMMKDASKIPLWIDTSSTPHSLKQYSTASKVWSQIATTYVKISAPSIASSFKQYDAVKISGIPTDKIPQLKDLEGGVSVLWDAHHDEENPSSDYIVVIGFIDEVVTHESQLRIERRMPVMDFIIESENRLLGCRYGENINGEVVNEIYASKLGDFKNWNCFMGLSTDSYVASCGTDGQFTGAITHLGYPLFFKENYVHKVYGNYPANFSIQTTALRGVQKGCSKSLAIVNETLFYKSRNSVCAYDGSLPVEISNVFGDVSYRDAVACSHGNKYYISMKDTANEYHLFVYDTSKGLWHKEDNLAVKEFCSCRNELYYILQDGTDIKTMFGSGTADINPVSWMAETGVIGMYTSDKKYVSRLNIRMSTDIGTKVQLFAQYDSGREWELLYTMNSTSLCSFSVPIRPRRCDHFRLRIVGEGDAKIFSITKTLEQGSDR